MKTLEDLILTYSSKEEMNNEDRQQFESWLGRETNTIQLKRMAKLDMVYQEIAVFLFERAIELNSQDIEAIVGMGLSLWCLGNEQESKVKLKVAKEIRPERLDVLCLSHLNGGLNSQEMALFERLLAKEYNTNELNYLGRVSYPESEISVPLYQRLIELEPKNVKAILHLGGVFWLIGEDDNSRIQLNKAKEINPERVDVLFLEATLASDEQSKIQLCEKILEKEPDNKVVRANLENLKSSDINKIWQFPAS
ncbi:tetratricopeptide repeat protein [Oscillatoria salina]|uniref:tetratricopeptide repeat protein n=1 Tax=Oscillatoria salina TaxID=331517 RepID=UPI001CCDADF7|nr:hypothetical protein [Oscillatoria salina]MBZ8178548.1 hypothetical protein [Oscillatoria salina IIICB1]